MKLAVIVAFGLFSVAHAGVAVLSPHEEAEVLAVFKKLCYERDEGGEFNGARVWCKFGSGQRIEVVNHDVLVPAPQLPDQVVYIQPHPVLFKHNVAISGNSVAPKTKIYVVPPQVKHDVESTVIPGSIVTSKPTVYFLKSNGDEEYRYGSPLPRNVAGYQ